MLRVTRLSFTPLKLLYGALMMYFEGDFCKGKERGSEIV